MKSGTALGSPADYVEISFDDWTDRFDSSHLQIYCDEELCYDSTINENNTHTMDWPGEKYPSVIFILQPFVLRNHLEDCECSYCVVTGYHGNAPLHITEVKSIRINFESDFCYYSVFTLPCWGYKIRVNSMTVGDGWNCTTLAQVDILNTSSSNILVTAETISG
jgi:hypothetical protein